MKPNPLWLPQGSVRAVILLGITGTVLGMACAGISVPDQLWVSFAAIWGTYIGTRASSSNGSQK